MSQFFAEKIEKGVSHKVGWVKGTRPELARDALCDTAPFFKLSKVLGI